MEGPTQTPELGDTKVVPPAQYDVSTKMSTSPLYMYNKLYPHDGNTTKALSATQNTNVDFHLPANVLLNIARSRVEFILQVVTPADYNEAAAGGANADRIAIAHHILPFDIVRWRTQRGANLVNINDAQDYHRLVAQPCLKRAAARLESEPNELPALLSTTIAAAEGDTSTGALTLYGYGDSTSGKLAAGAAAPTVIELKYVDGAAPSGVLLRATSAGANASAAVTRYIKFSIPLSNLLGTVFAYDKSIMLPEVTVLSTNFSPHTRIAYIVKGLDTTSRALGSAQFHNMRLLLCVDENANAIATWNDQLASGGFTFFSPYTTMHRLATPNAASSTHMIRIGRGDGSSLLRIHSALRRDASDLYHSLPYSNAARDETKIYQTYKDGKPLQPQQLVVADGDDWTFNMNFFEESYIVNRHVYRERCPVHIDTFGSNSTMLSDARVTDFMRTGLPLNGEVIYMRTDSTKGARVHYLMLGVVTQKMFVFSRLNGISVE